MRWISALPLLGILAGCDKPFGWDPPSMSGSWYAETEDIQFTATQSGYNTFVGSGTIFYSTGTARAMEINGVNEYPHVSFTMIDANSFALNYSGTWRNESMIVGTMSGYSNGSAPRTFTRR